MTDFSQAQLDETPARALKFLDGARVGPIRMALEARGYSDDDHEEGWRLLLKASGRIPKAPLPTDTATREALSVLDAWDEPTFQIAYVALDRKFPVQRDFVFMNLQAATGAWAIVTVATFLDRLDVLEIGKDRAATHEADLKALALLSKRGITKGERTRMRALVEIAKSSEPGTEPAVQQSYEQAETERQKGLIELRGWYEEWAGVAHAVIKRRDYLIRLGLAKRKASKKKGGGEAGGGAAPGK